MAPIFLLQKKEMCQEKKAGTGEFWVGLKSCHKKGFQKQQANVMRGKGF